MANQLYGSYSKSAAAAAAASTFGAQLHPSSATSFSSRSSLPDSDPYSSRYLDSAVTNPFSDYTSMYSSTSRFPSSSLYSLDQDPVLSALKRPSEVFYHPTVLGSHNTIGQNDWLTTSYLKRPRLENASHLPIYPQRPGEKDCAHYMLTRTCKFGESCKFDHPIWVPEGGIPDWKEVLPVNPPPELLPERPGEPDCPYFLKTQRCKFGVRCKFNHPKNQVVSSGVTNVNVSGLPDQPSEPPCAFYLKTGLCKFGSTCKFHHPKDIQIASAGQESGSAEQSEHAIMNLGLPTDLKSGISVVPALLHNSKGLPIRPGEVDCPFYLKTGSCKYSSTCRYNHPERTAINPPAAGIGHSFGAPSAASLGISVVNPAVSVLQAVDPRLAPPALGFAPAVYPQRPGQMECDFYMKTGVCKFGEKCRYHHPIDRSAPSSKQETVKLTLAGLPRREGAIICPYYMKTSTCKYGATCKFDHPPPGEVMAMASAQGTTATDGESKADE